MVGKGWKEGGPDCGQHTPSQETKLGPLKRGDGYDHVIGQLSPPTCLAKDFCTKNKLLPRVELADTHPRKTWRFLHPQPPTFSARGWRKSFHSLVRFKESLQGVVHKTTNVNILKKEVRDLVEELKDFFGLTI
ncbi:hypothetical protein CDAR_236341 [Caerostris darwini]|uniref:Uncharacterized protein n=1 Tax=Caerostris darwini TaxID=1538125 RepID=A0AAV4T6Q5_9ARAC|nr:hypothetical protein CDAR_236341 [Caerostris darwini]